MKKPFIMLFWLIATAACNPAASDNSEANIAIVQNYLEAVSNHDYDAMASILSDDYLGLGPSVGDTIRKQEAIDSWKYNSDNVYESVVYELSQMLPANIAEGPAAGEWVSNWTYLTITYKDGRGPVNVWVNAVYKIEDGKIDRSRTFYNEADVLGQLGYRVFPPLTVPDSVNN
ncbi:MAG: nuclear transport factor 2 family protein [Cyclobacteriaceae bacterium]|nr:nuclear transport factor 2 family protein [Cyclobacteriaceae bacterium]